MACTKVSSKSSTSVLLLRLTVADAPAIKIISRRGFILITGAGTERAKDVEEDEEDDGDDDQRSEEREKSYPKRRLRGFGRWEEESES
mmetsp:Transcript_17466/g.37944  ORF Transcript_17466/g.37944 Transcript_17466/m.37944 type:complete len:88 (-) Transcript_17466:672-935(-)